MANTKPNSRPGPRRNRQRAGFTIIELLMVMVVIGILAQIGSQKYGAYLVRVRVAKAICNGPCLAPTSAA